ncbi:hypothetical protein C438_05627 [Haloferax denitrificans ATCC 35960]|uniref:Uncharacterized protein n=1 Tax=Haloferax denitrificans ATCC 35960 TaxID=662478 RepID=M0JC79_9EURY|nr:hypothetical protein C438_05627 [Haloferax denitrificans ATCC 35960]
MDLETDLSLKLVELVDGNLVFGVSGVSEMMGSGQPNSEELIVKAKQFLAMEPTEENLRRI